VELTRANFPDAFTFGVATSAYQIEGHSFGDAGSTHWDRFAATPGNVMGGENGAIACDHYHRFGGDLDLVKAAGFDAYRFSTSWARVLPEGRGQVNEQGLDFYDRLVDAMLARGIRPFQTLYHWEMPSALSDLGGWTNRDVALWFGDYTEIIMKRLGDRVESVATINEPWCVAYLSHFLGVHAPGLRDIRATARAMHHVLLAHGQAMGRLREMGQKNCGIVLNFDYVQAASQTPGDLAAAAREEAIFNRWFIEGITRATYPAQALEGFGPHMPLGWENDMAEIGQPIDWLGVNYYTRHIVADDPAAAWPHGRAIKGELPKTQMDWEIYSEGLHYFLTWLDENYTRGLPLFVTENGIACDDHPVDGIVSDTGRVDFIDRHLQAIGRAIGDGANVQGYFYWSLLDNYEWAEGYDKKFGLVHVDFATQKRTPKASYHALKNAIART